MTTAVVRPTYVITALILIAIPPLSSFRSNVAAWNTI